MPLAGLVAGQALAADGFTVTTFHRQQDAAQYGEYSGLQRSGPGVIIDGALDFALEGDVDRRVRLAVANLGLDTYLARARFDDAGRLRIRLDIEGQQQVERLDLTTPFDSASLQLGGAWVGAAGTEGFTGTGPFTGGVDEVSGRQQIRFDARCQVNPRSTLTLNYQWQKFDGTQIRGVATYLDANSPFAALLPAPVNAVEQTLSVQLDTTLLGVRLSTSGGWSRFDDSSDLLTWQVPWMIGLPGTDFPDGRGALSGSPDHDRFFGRLAFAARPFPGLSVAFDADGSLTRMDTDVADWTVNGTLATPLPLPLERFDVEQADVAFSGRLRYRPTDGALRRSSVRLAWRYRERDSDMPRLPWAYPPGDAFDQPDADQALLNTVHDNDLQSLVAGLDVRTPWQGQATAELRWRERNRDNAAVNTNTTEGVHGSYRFRPVDSIALRLETTLETTDASLHDFRRSYLLRRTEAFIANVPEDQRFDNHPFLRQYHLAPHESRAWRARVAWTPTARGDWQFQLGGQFDVRERKYEDSPFGLISRDGQTYALDASLVMGNRMSWSGWASVEFADVRSAGRAFGGGIEKPANQVQAPLAQGSDPAQDWRSDFEDRIFALGAAVEWQPRPFWTFTGDYTLTFTRSGQRLATGTALTSVGGDLPTVETDLHHLRLRLDRATAAGFRFGFAWEFYRFDQTDWALDDVTPTTLGNVLLAGERNHDEIVQLLAVHVGRRF